MATPPAAMSIPYPLETVPSLEVSEQEDHSLVLQAIKALHDSVVAQLEQLDGRVQRLADSITAVRSCRSPAVRKSKSQAARAEDGLAMQVLQMNLSHSGAPVSSRSLKSSSGASPTPTHQVPALSILPAEIPGAPLVEQHMEQAELIDEQEAMKMLTDSVRQDTAAMRQVSSDVKESTTLSKDEERSKRSKRSVGAGAPGHLDAPEKCTHASSENSASSFKERRPSMKASPENSIGSLKESRRSSVKLDKAVTKGQLSEVFKVREAELTATLALTHRRSDTTPCNEKSISRSASRSATVPDISDEDTVVQEVLYDSDSWSAWWLKLNWLNIFVACYASKALGLIPLFEIDFEMDWKSRCRRFVSRLYHWLLIFLLLGAVIYCVMRFGHCRMREVVLDDELHAEPHWPALAVDIFLFVGASMVLSSWGGVKSYQATTDLVGTSLDELTSYCHQHGLATAWRIWSCSDALWALLLWFALLFGRFALFTWNAWHEGTWWWGTLPLVAAYSLGTGVLVVASFWQVRTSHAMLLIVNAWSASVLRRDFSCIRSKQEWKRISGLFRKTSRAFERCFAALGATIVMLILSALIDLSHRWDVEIFASLAVALFLAGVLWTNASTTTACSRLPSLVMLLEAEDEEEDAEYMDLAMFLHMSECGFFMWDTCVTLGLVQKFLYFTTAVAGSIGFQLGAFSGTWA